MKNMTNIKKNMIESYNHIPYTFKHYIAFLKTEKELLGSYKYKFHDLDKIVMYILIPFIGPKKIKDIHRKRRHHIEKEKNVKDCNYEEAIIDWECSRFTKPDKPETARELTERKYPKYPQHYTQLLYILYKLNL